MADQAEPEDVVSWRLKQLETGLAIANTKMDGLTPLTILLPRLEQTVSRIEAKLDQKEKEVDEEKKHVAEITLQKQGLHQAYSAQNQYKWFAWLGVGITLIINGLNLLFQFLSGHHP